ncbi:condensin complex subunit 2 isoform X1 [Apium graveolens]|uniref:condensin complex subunit 2 isoform X1 n=1 Tax=Apium graveolens TaxID=4045 RepID=UPI003D7A6418
MAENVSPNPKQRAQLLSPSSPFFLASNDDKLERAQARAAARAAATRRKATAAAAAAPESTPCLDKEHILDLFHNCIKLASENKINQKNTWELSLIDHLCDIIKVDAEDDVETNFQKASCTLEAGVKIYSMRVDSVHSEAYKVLGGINRVGQENEEDGTVEDSNIDGQEEDNSKKEKDRKLSPLSTLESSFDALNVKKFDAAFAVDPLYHQTSAQFDEGGAKGLLLNNLGVYGGCRVLFDSSEVPAKCSSGSNQHDKGAMIDISFAKECSEEMFVNMSKKFEISPSLREIVNHFDDDNKRPPDTFSFGTKPTEEMDEPYDNGAEFNADTFDNAGTWDDNQDDQTNLAYEGTYGDDPIMPSQYEVKESTDFHENDTDDRFGEIDDYLFLNLGFTSKLNAWAGPDHWKFRKVKVPQNVSEDNGSPVITKKTKNKKQTTVDIDFLTCLDKDMSDIFAPPKNPKTLLLPTSKEPCSTTLPEDCHYQPENLVKLFLLPNVMCLGRSRKKSTAEMSHEADNYDNMQSWNYDTGFADHFDDGNDRSDGEESNTLVSQPRQVNKIEVQYDRKSKQVDVQVLKETLWGSLQESQVQSVQEQGGTISFKDALAAFPDDCKAAESLKDISPHLCFICLLHLANEHGLSIQGQESLDDLSIHLPQQQ